MSDIWVVLAVAVGSYALRTSFIVFARQRAGSLAIVGILDQIKPAALAALTATAVVSHDGLTATHMVALGVTALAAHKGVDLLGALVLGMVALALGQLIF